MLHAGSEFGSPNCAEPPSAKGEWSSETTAVVLIGFQNDYFSPDGRLFPLIEDPSQINRVLSNTVALLERLADAAVIIIATPIVFTTDYGELIQPIGILRDIKNRRAFQAGFPGSELIPQLVRFKDRLIPVPGRRGLNAFSNTELDRLLRQRGIRDVVLAGVVTSLCIDSTGRSAFERGYRVTILSDCTSARTRFEQNYYCTEIFPMYARVLTHAELLNALELQRC